MANVFNVAKRGIIDGSIDFTNDVFEVLLFSASPNANLTDAQLDLTTVANVEAATGFDEATHASYTGVTGGISGSGRMLLGARTPSTDDTNNRAEQDAPDITWAAQTGYTIQGALLYKRVGTAGPAGDATHIPIAYYDLGGAAGVVTNGGDIILQWNTEGFLQLTE